MSAAWRTILVRYGEIGIKGPTVRARFEKRLAANIESQLAREGVEGAVDRERGRLFLRTNNPDGAMDVLRRTFGVVGGKLAEEMPADKETICASVAEAAKARLRPGQSFAVRARRTGTHPYTSMELGRDVGSAVYTAFNGEVRVDLTDPDVELEIEVRGSRAYFIERSVEGPGGLPVGSQGKVAVLVEDARGVLAAWLLLKRGVSALLLSPEPVGDEVRRAVAVLDRWTPHLAVRAFTAPTAEPAPRRAFLLAVAGALARRDNLQAVAVGDGLEGVRGLSGLDAFAGTPVFRPLIGYPGELLRALVDESGIPVLPELPAHAHDAPVAPPPANEVEDALGTLRPLSPEVAP